MSKKMDAHPDGWNYVPELPLKPAPYWAWPPQPVKVLQFWFDNFMTQTDRVLFVLLAFGVAFWAQPFAATEANLAFGWIAWALIRNLLLVGIVVGGLHIWFYGVDGQGNLVRYDSRPITGRKNALFKFGYQTWDNMFYTLAYGVPIATAWEVGIRWAWANEWTMGAITFSSNPIWFIAIFPILTFWQSFHFYLIHRLLHWPPLYRQVHSVHHRNVNIGPWSGLSIHPFEHLLYFSTLVIFFLLPAHPVHVIFLLFWQLLGAPTGHSGYEAVWAKDKRALILHGFFHQLHHRYYECNYGSGEFPFDKWFGTYHDGSEQATIDTRARKRVMHAKS